MSCHVIAAGGGGGRDAEYAAGVLCVWVLLCSALLWSSRTFVIRGGTRRGVYRELDGLVDGWLDGLFVRSFVR